MDYWNIGLTDYWNLGYWNIGLPDYLNIGIFGLLEIKVDLEIERKVRK